MTELLVLLLLWLRCDCNHAISCSQLWPQRWCNCDQE